VDNKERGEEKRKIDVPIQFTLKVECLFQTHTTLLKYRFFRPVAPETTENRG